MSDVDLVILPGDDYPRDQESASEIESLYPFLQILVAADEIDLLEWATSDFGTDRNMLPKGVIEVVL